MVLKSDDAVRISNVRVRRTTTGELVNAHDGMFTDRLPDGRFWLFGTAYRNCTDFDNCTYPCGWLENRFAAYSSPTLGMDDWRLESDNILPSVANDTSYTSYFEPNVLYSKATKQYVLSWSHLLHNQSPPPVQFVHDPKGAPGRLARESRPVLMQDAGANRLR